MDSVKREYEYRPKWSAIILCAVCFGLCAVFFGFEAVSNERGLIINHVIELSPTWATGFYWALTAVCVGFVVLAAFLTYHRLTFRQRLVFGAMAMTVPASRWSRNEQEIAYRDIRALSEETISGHQFLHLMHSDGKYTIPASMLPSKAAFAEICELLAARVRDNR